MKDNYQISDLEKDATLDEVKTSFKKSIAKIHLESNGDDKLATDRCQDIIKSYSIFFKKYHYNISECFDEYLIEMNEQIDNSLKKRRYFYLKQLHEKIDDYGSKILNIFLVLYGIGLVCYLGYLIYYYPRSFNYFFNNILTELDYFVTETKTPFGIDISIYFALGIGIVIALLTTSLKCKAISQQVYKDFNIQTTQNTDRDDNTKNNKKKDSSKREDFLNIIIFIVDLLIEIAVILALEWLLFTYCSFNSYIMIVLAISIIVIIVFINAKIVKYYFPNIGTVRNPNYK